MLILYVLSVLFLLAVLVVVWLVIVIETRQDSPMFSYLDAQRYVDSTIDDGEEVDFESLVEPFEYYSWEEADRQLIDTNEQEHIDRMHAWAETSLAEEAQLEANQSTIIEHHASRHTG